MSGIIAQVDSFVNKYDVYNIYSASRSAAGRERGNESDSGGAGHWVLPGRFGESADAGVDTDTLVHTHPGEMFT